jgi:predicted peroxiredoxin
MNEQLRQTGRTWRMFKLAEMDALLNKDKTIFVVMRNQSIADAWKAKFNQPNLKIISKNSQRFKDISKVYPVSILPNNYYLDHDN